MRQSGLGAPLRSRARPSLAPSSPAQLRTSPRAAGPRTRVTFTGPEIFSQGGRENGGRARGRIGGGALSPVTGGFLGLGLPVGSLRVPRFTRRAGGKEWRNGGGALSPASGGVLGLGLVDGPSRVPPFNLGILSGAQARLRKSIVSARCGAMVGGRDGLRATPHNSEISKSSRTPELPVILGLCRRGRAAARVRVGGGLAHGE
jgi:hypothetical protein